MPTDESPQRKFAFGSEPKASPAPEPLTGTSETHFVYRTNDHYVMMDSDSFDEIELKEASIGPAAKFLKEGQDGITIIRLLGFIVEVRLPAIVELQVESLVAPDENQTGTMIARLETGAEVTVPNHVRPGQMIQIDTKSLTYKK